MTAPTDDFGLTRLFIPRSAGTATRSPTGGTMIAWDAVTGANTVIIGSTTYTNLSVISPNGLTLGPVMVQRTAAGWVVMGMITNPNSGGDILDPLRYREQPSDLTSVDTTLIDAGALQWLLRENSKYGLDGVLWVEAPGASDLKFAWTGPANMAVKWAMHGTAAATSGTSGNLDVVTQSAYGDATTAVVSGAATLSHCSPKGWFSTTDTPGLLQLRFACNSGVGPSLIRAGSWLRLADLGLSGGSTTFIKTYICTASRSYDGSGNPIGATDQDNNCYQGEFPDRSFGNERSMVVFPGSTIRSDLTGATILSARLWLYCHKAEEAKGSLIEPRTETNTSVPATYSPSGTSSDTSQHDTWTVNSWNSVECLYKGGAASLMNGIIGGGNSIGLPPTLFGLGATGFRGFGFGASTRPYLEVTYAV